MSHLQSRGVRLKDGRIMLVKGIIQSSPKSKAIKFKSDDAAAAHAERTNQFLGGPFKTFAESTKFAIALSRKSDRKFDVGDRSSPKRRLSGTGKKRK